MGPVDYSCGCGRINSLEPIPLLSQQHQQLGSSSFDKVAPYTFRPVFWTVSCFKEKGEGAIEKYRYLDRYYLGYLPILASIYVGFMG